MVKLGQCSLPPYFSMKKKDENGSRSDNNNNFNGGGDRGKKAKESNIRDRLHPRTNEQFELENTESNGNGGMTKMLEKHLKNLEVEQKKLSSETRAIYIPPHRRVRHTKDLKKAKDNDNNGSSGGGGGDDDNNGGGGRKNNKKGSDRDSDGNGDKDKCGRDDGRGEMKGKNTDFMGEAMFGYGYIYHAGNENGYPVGQIQCAQEVQSSDTKFFLYPAIMKMKDKNSGGDDCNKGEDGEKKKEKDPSKIQDRLQQKTVTRLELENTESNGDRITKNNKMLEEQYSCDFEHKNSSEEPMRRQRSSLPGHLCRSGSDIANHWEAVKDKIENKKDNDNNYNGDGGCDEDNNGSGGGKSNEKGRDHYGDGNEDKWGRDDNEREIRIKNTDLMGKVGFGYRYGSHVENESGYPVGQLQCAQEVQSSEPKCLLCHTIS